MFDSVKHPLALNEKWTPVAGKWWCGHCIDSDPALNGWHAHASVKHHVSSEHGVSEDSQEVGYDTLTTEDLWLALRRHHSRNHESVAKFMRQLATIVGPDDFITDCG